jgi:hypothetical protein
MDLRKLFSFFKDIAGLATAVLLLVKTCFELKNTRK